MRASQDCFPCASQGISDAPDEGKRREARRCPKARASCWFSTRRWRVSGFVCDMAASAPGLRNIGSGRSSGDCRSARPRRSTPRKRGSERSLRSRRSISGPIRRPKRRTAASRRLSRSGRRSRPTWRAGRDASGRTSWPTCDAICGSTGRRCTRSPCIPSRVRWSRRGSRRSRQATAYTPRIAPAQPCRLSTRGRSARGWPTKTPLSARISPLTRFPEIEC